MSTKWEEAVDGPAPATEPKRPFAIGDVVTLKSGSNMMTVTDVRCTSIVEVSFWACVEGSMTDQYNQLEIHEACLRRVPDKELERRLDYALDDADF